jgi:hypothetical protein
MRWIRADPVSQNQSVIPDGAADPDDTGFTIWSARRPRDRRVFRVASSSPAAVGDRHKTVVKTVAELS